MKKRCFIITIIAIVLFMLFFTSCEKSEFGIIENTGKVLTIKADNADKDNYFAVGTLEVADREQIVINSNLENGTVKIEIIASKGGESADKLPELSQEPVMTANVKGNDSQSGYVATGDYMIKATCIEKSTGTVKIEVMADVESVKSITNGFNNGKIVKEGINVEAVFVGNKKQPFTENDGDKGNVDTIWIYYSDMTFEQFAIIEDKTILFSTGTYKFENGGDFIYAENDKDHGNIVINRTKKYESSKGLIVYSSSHSYALNTLGFSQLYAPDETKHIVTVFSGPEKQPFEIIDQNDGKMENTMVDTWWVYYDDSSFEQYAEINDKIELFSFGTYEFKDGGDYIYSVDESDHGKITINRIKKYKDGEGLIDHKSSHTYDLNTLGYDQLFIVKKG